MRQTQRRSGHLLVRERGVQALCCRVADARSVKHLLAPGLLRAGPRVRVQLFRPVRVRHFVLLPCVQPHTLLLRVHLVKESGRGRRVAPRSTGSPAPLACSVSTCIKASHLAVRAAGARERTQVRRAARQSQERCSLPALRQSPRRGTGLATACLAASAATCAALVAICRLVADPAQHLPAAMPSRLQVLQPGATREPP